MAVSVFKKVLILECALQMFRQICFDLFVFDLHSFLYLLI